MMDVSAIQTLLRHPKHLPRWRKVQRDLVVNYRTADSVLAAQSLTPDPEAVAVETRSAAYIIQQKASCTNPLSYSRRRTNVHHLLFSPLRRCAL